MIMLSIELINQLASVIAHIPGQITYCFINHGAPTTKVKFYIIPFFRIVPGIDIVYIAGIYRERKLLWVNVFFSG